MRMLRSVHGEMSLGSSTSEWTTTIAVGSFLKTLATANAHARRTRRCPQRVRARVHEPRAHHREPRPNIPFDRQELQHGEHLSVASRDDKVVQHRAVGHGIVDATCQRLDPAQPVGGDDHAGQPQGRLGGGRPV